MQSNSKPGPIRSRMLGLALVAAIASSGSVAHSAELTIARGVDTDALDPIAVSTTASFQALGLMFDTLVSKGEGGVISPGLADEWSVSDDGLTYTFGINSPKTCHDGSLLDAEGVAAHISRAIDPANASPNLSSWGDVQDISADGNTLTIQLGTPDSRMLSFLTGLSSQIACPSSWAGDEFTPIGTGPFIYESWVRNDSMVLKVNPDYRNTNALIDNPGAPNIDQVTFRVIPEAVARLAALRSGEVDVVEPSLEEAEDLTDEGYNLVVSQLSGQQVFGAYTWQRAPLDNPEVRRAIAMALNPEAYAEIAFSGLVEVAPCPAAPRLLAIDLDKCREWGVQYDPEGAKEILAEHGYTESNPLTLKLAVHRLVGWDQMHQMMQQDLANVNVNAEIETREVAAFFDYVAEENSHPAEGEPIIYTLGNSGSDPDYMRFIWRQPGFSNMGLNDEMDQMLDAQRQATGEERVQILQDIQKYLLENSYTFPLVSPGWSFLVATSPAVDGYRYGYTGAILLGDVTISE